MKHFHVHVAVENLEQSIGFYSTVFAAPPTVLKPDYAKWVLDDPRVNFAISQRGAEPGIEHLGIQVENEAELNEVYARLAKAERPVIEEKATTCCYAQSDKQWIADPTGISWETFLTHGEATVYGGGLAAAGPNTGGACCGPSCCTPEQPKETTKSCCVQAAEWP
ncbi:MAG TPA: ArsI/CadI family heavy metal resistance metalloenzyme [Micropepsaceae bacterium]|nr:ArsI/CadI family heavy metal resistance metalloenzyme [Micropepsaceae bacterium]